MDPPGLSDFFVPADHPQHELVTAGHHLVWAFEAECWEDAMVLYFCRGLGAVPPSLRLLGVRLTRTLSNPSSAGYFRDGQLGRNALWRPVPQVWIQVGNWTGSHDLADARSS